MALIPENIQAQLNNIDNSKFNIKNAILAKGGIISDSEPFANYGSIISNIPGGILQTKSLIVDSTTPTLVSIIPDEDIYGLEQVDVDLSYIEDELDDILGNSVISINYGPPREITAQGVYQISTTNTTFSLPSNATSLNHRALIYAFSGSPSLTSVDLSNITSVAGTEALYCAFNGCTNLASVDLHNLRSITGYNALYYAFNGCTSLNSVDLSSLVTINSNGAMNTALYGCSSLISVSFPNLVTLKGDSAWHYLFHSCSNLTSVSLPNLEIVEGFQTMGGAFIRCGFTSISFPSLTTIRGNGAMSGMFYQCSSLKSVSFPALISTFNIPESGTTYTNMFDHMLEYTTDCVVHFPSNLQSVIGSWTDVTNGFRGTNATVLFDLPATT